MKNLFNFTPQVFAAKHLLSLVLKNYSQERLKIHENIIINRFAPLCIEKTACIKTHYNMVTYRLQTPGTHIPDTPEEKATLHGAFSSGGLTGVLPPSKHIKHSC
jgi:hypothetical protein